MFRPANCDQWPTLWRMHRVLRSLTHRRGGSRPRAQTRRGALFTRRPIGLPPTPAPATVVRELPLLVADRASLAGRLATRSIRSAVRSGTPGTPLRQSPGVRNPPAIAGGSNSRTTAGCTGTMCLRRIGAFRCGNHSRARNLSAGDLPIAAHGWLSIGRQRFGGARMTAWAQSTRLLVPTNEGWW